MKPETSPQAERLMNEFVYATYSLSDRLLIAWKWLLSFGRSWWRLSDYPIRIRQQGEQMTQVSHAPLGEPASPWVAEILNWPGPVGLGPNPPAAQADLAMNFVGMAKAKMRMGLPLPRPGCREPFKLASAARVYRNPQLLRDFLTRVLGIDPDHQSFVSDGSLLYHFGTPDDVERYRQLIRSHYGVDTCDIKDGNLADILERIEQHRRGQ